MNTPICDFVRRYADKDTVRLHMPGHKGNGFLGCEALDITEISGADSLYEASGIIKESESNASSLFGCDTYYSTEGSSQCIRAMLYLAMLDAKSKKKPPLVLATRNAHKVFLLACAVLDFPIEWLYGSSYLCCEVSEKDIEEAILKHSPSAIYLTSPDYLGNLQDIAKISEVCKRHDVLLLVDGAHGAYLKFLPTSLHPADLGADMVCSSAHKTLPVLTGGAYLHICRKELSKNAKNALALFGSTSPSYLILQSLDLANRYIANGYAERLADFCSSTAELKRRLLEYGYTCIGDEPAKLTLSAKPFGYKASDLAIILEEKGLVCEFCDSDFIVFMLSPESDGAIALLERELLSLKREKPIVSAPPKLHRCRQVMTPREAVFSPCEAVETSRAVGRVLAFSSVGCPPAVPIVMCGEEIDENAVECFRYYGIEKCEVII